MDESKEIVPFNNIFSIFNFQGHDLRTIIVDGVAYAVAKDACDMLDITNVSQAVESLKDDEKLLYAWHISGQRRNIWLVNIPGFNHLIFKSTKAEAEAVQHWVWHKVMPSIYTIGSYELPKNMARQITGFSADLNPYLGLTELDKINALDKLARSVRNLEYATHESEAHLQMKTLLFHIFGIMNSSHIPETYLDQLLIEVMKMRADAADERKYNNLMNSPVPPEIHNLVYRILAPIIRDWQRRGKKV